MMSSSSPRHLLCRQPSTLSASPSSLIRPSFASAPQSRRAASSATSASPNTSSLASRRRNAHYAATTVSSYASQPPPPPPLSRARPPLAPTAPEWEEDLASSFAASLQASLAEDYVRQRDDGFQAHPQWEDGGHRAGEERGEGLFLGEEAEVDETSLSEETGELADWREMVAAVRGEFAHLREQAVEQAEAVEVKPPATDSRSLEQAKAQEAQLDLLGRATRRDSAAVFAPTETTLQPSPELLFAPPPPRRRRSTPVDLKPAERLSFTSFIPYGVPPVSEDLDAALQTSTSVEPHFTPLLSRQDWRLSSPLRRFVRTTPPPLFSMEETATMPLGHGQLVGVGTEAARIARKGVTRTEEQWGWKTKVPEKEKGRWEAGARYKERMLRLLTYSRIADEKAYQSSLLRSGTPQEREARGLTVCRAQGTWLGDAAKVDELVTMAPEERVKRREAGSAAPARAICEWRKEDGLEIGEEQGYRFVEGSIIRFSRATASSPHPLNPVDSTGPQPPVNGGALVEEQRERWFVQGTLLEHREGRLIVAFDEDAMWQLGDEAYQIDIGLDDTAYALQEAALENLYFDPARQRQRNVSHVEDAQQVFRQSSVASTLREWTLQGTELRELFVPSISANGSKSPSVPAGSIPMPASTVASPPPATPSLTADWPLSTNLAPADSLHPSELLRQNQLINSWIKRYSREEPLAMPGDPDLGLNESQMRAIAMALGERLSLIQGPPGTGKSQTIVSLISLLKLHFRVPFPILLAAPTHVSVDHLLSLLVRAGLNPLRCGKASKVSNPEAEKWTIEKRREQHPLWQRMEQAREESETARLGVLELREAAVVGELEQKKAEKATFTLEEKYRKAWRKFVMLEQKLYASLLATADVFCATALGSGASKVLSMVDFPLVLLDEAAMCTEPVSLIPMMKGAQHATLIGDHKQLPAVVTSSEAKNERLHISLFERLLATQTVKSTLLDTQYRMRPDISAFPNLSFYHSALRDAPSVTDRPPPPRSRFLSPPLAPAPALSRISLSKSPSSASPPQTPSPASKDPVPVAFVSHAGEERLHRQSILNRAEVSLLVEIVGDLLLQNPTLAANDIGIISPYYAQTRLLINTFESGYASSRLRKLLGPRRAAEVSEVEVNTVDGFQGREKRVVLLSTVRSNPAGAIGFLTDRRRLNVALTRARDALIVVGNEETLRKAALNEWASPDPDADAGVWRRFLQWCDRRGLVKRVVRPGQAGPHPPQTFSVRYFSGSGERQFNGLLDVYKKTIASDGVAGLYRGFLPSVVGIAVYRGLYFGMYDSLKPVVMTGSLQGSFLASFLLGWGVTTGAGIASYPLDTFRRRMMMTPGEKGVFQFLFPWSGDNMRVARYAGRKIVTAEGVSSLFKGAGANILRGVASASVLSMYDKLQELVFGKVYSGGSG
ncbi:hypothetical protein JCM11641_007986 [Rhodosporidiobolus odoratus]